MSALMALLCVGFALVVGQGYQNRHENWQRDYDTCIETVANRWQSAQAQRKNAERETFLAGRTKGDESRLHAESATEATLVAEALEMTSAPSDKRRVAYCKRTNPEPGIIW